MGIDPGISQVDAQSQAGVFVLLRDSVFYSIDSKGRKEGFQRCCIKRIF